MEKKNEDNYYLMTPCCMSTDIMCYLTADFNGVRACEIEPERHFGWSHSDAFPEVYCNECNEEVDVNKLIISDHYLLDSE